MYQKFLVSDFNREDASLDKRNSKKNTVKNIDVSYSYFHFYIILYLDRNTSKYNMIIT